MISKIACVFAVIFLVGCSGVSVKSNTCKKQYSDDNETNAYSRSKSRSELFKNSIKRQRTCHEVEQLKKNCKE